jgi:hypothetical protein
MTTSSEFDGLVGEDEPEVPYRARTTPNTTPSGVLEPELVAQPLSKGRVRINGKFVVQVTVHRHVPPNGRPVWVACAVLETNGEPIQWCAIASEHEVAKRLQMKGAIAGFQPGGRAVQQGAQRSAFQKVVGDARRTLDRPEAQAALNATAVIPYVGPIVQGLRAATTLVDNVANGDRGARNRLGRLRGAADRGNPQARQAIGIVERVLRSQRRGAIDRARAQRPRRTSSDEERAWSEAARRWNEWRAQQAQGGALPPEPDIPND